MVKKSNKIIQDAVAAASQEMARTGRGKKFRQSHFKDKKTGRTVLDTDRNRERYGPERIIELKKSGGSVRLARRGGLKGGGISQRGLGRAFKKGGKNS